MSAETNMTDAEVLWAVEMRRKGYGLSRIAQELGRKPRTVQSRLRKQLMSRTEKDEDNAKRNVARRVLKPDSNHLFVSEDGTGTAAGRVWYPKPTAEMIADRDRRYSRGFSIAWDVLGDPETGRSALDMKMRSENVSEG
jgi:hypothetical protein